MAKKAGFEFMTQFVAEYLSGDIDRLDWDLNFSHYLIKHYPKMERENSELAECFNFYLAEQGFDEGLGLSGAEHKKLIQKQFAEFMAVTRDGFC